MNPGNAEHPPRDPRDRARLDTYPVAHVEALQARLAELERANKDLRDLFAEADTERNGAIAAVRAASSAIDTLAEMRADAQQARCDEAWAHGQIMPVDFAPLESGWEAGWWDGEKKISATAPTIHAALRALRAKVEGGAR